jgi:hypothetical protein
VIRGGVLFGNVRQLRLPPKSWGERVRPAGRCGGQAARATPVRVGPGWATLVGGGLAASAVEGAGAGGGVDRGRSPRAAVPVRPT